MSPLSPHIAEVAQRRAIEAFESGRKHGKAARNWEEIAAERPDSEAVSVVLGRWMRAYQDADLAAEAEFSKLAQAGGKT